MIDENQLLAQGYRRYKNPTSRDAWDKWFFQKRIRDDVGTRYFMDVQQYDWRSLHMERQDISYEARVDFYDADGETMLRITVMQPWAMESVLNLEQFVANLYDNLPNVGHYERSEG
jgi:hypothetical protein